MKPLDWRGILERAGADQYAPEGSQGHSLHLLELRLSDVIDALRWYVANDDVEFGLGGNEFWIEGYARGLSALAALNSGGCVMNDFERDLAALAHEARLRAIYAAEEVEFERKRPFFLLRPKMFPDGNQWCALYGENIQEGVAGFGDTPADAATDFDIHWMNEKARSGASPMNIDRLTTIAEWLEAGAPHRDGVDGFDMSTFRNEAADCGTTCCIAGASAAFFSGRTPEELSFVGSHTAKGLLGLSYGQAVDLFYGTRHGTEVADLEEITPAWAARCIRKLIETGEVDWEGTRGEPA